METISHDQFKVDHLRQRIAALTLKHEDEVLEYAIQLQLVIQERDNLGQQGGQLAHELTVQNAEVARLRALCEENGVNYGPQAPDVVVGEVETQDE